MNNNGKSVNILTGAIIGNTIDSVKCALKLCEMKRWKCTIFLLSFFTIVLISCVAVLLIVGEPPEHKNDVPLHPGASSSSYPNSSLKSSRSNAEAYDVTDDNNHSRLHPNHDQHPNLNEHRHNYRRRFTDAIKGVFSDLINSSKNSTSSHVPILLDEVVPSHPSPSKESTENNSSRLKRQLDFGSGASSEEQNENSKEEYRTTQPSAMKYTPPSKRPFLRVIQTRRKSPRPASAESPSSSSPSPAVTTTTTSSSEEICNSDEQSNSQEGGNSSRERFRKRPFRRFRTASQNNRNASPKLQRVSSKEKYDISVEDNEPPRKNFTFEVVQLERKVVRKQDGHIPQFFKQENYNIEPRLAKVSKKENRNRPQVLYKRDPIIQKSDSPSVPLIRASSRQGKSASPEISSKEFDKSSGDASSEDRDRSVVVNLNSQIPYNDRDLSDEDLKDYHDGHSTFGSKGNFTHTILSRNVAGFVPNQSGENSNRRNKNDRTIVIQKGKVTERYPQEDNTFENLNTEIYSVPGGRSSSTENSAPKQEAFPFTRTSKRTKEVGVQDNDRTSPAIPSSLEELYKKGHPGVVPAPKKDSYREHPLSDPYGDNAVYSSPFKYNPLVDDPPLKFDSESDRFYGEPKLDNKERVAQSNSPAVQVESKGKQDRTGIIQPDDDFFRPVKRESEEDKSSSSREDDQSGSREQRPRSQNDRFFYGRAYNPPDYATEYDTEAAGDGDGENRRDNPNDQDNFDFVGLDENFEPSHSHDTGGVDSDFFEFPEGLGGLGGGRGGGARFRPRADQTGDDDEGHRNNDGDANRETGNSNRDRDYDEGTASREEEPVRRSPPPPPRQSSRKDEDDYDFGPAPVRNTEAADNDGHPELYDTGFIHTLKQFDEEIKKLQDEERQKLLDSTAHPQQETSTEQHPPPTPPRTTESGYKQDPPLVITSPGPLEHSLHPGLGPSTPEHSLEDVGTTIRVTDDEDEGEDDEPTRSPLENSREPSTESGEDFIRDHTTLPNRSVGAEEEEEEENTQRPGFGPGSPVDYSTESSSTEQIDGEKK